MNSYIQTPTNNLKESIDFYNRIGFKKVPSETKSLVTDGKILISIDPDRYARAGIKIFQSNWDQELTALEKLTKINEIEGGYLLSDPSGCRIYLMNGDSGINWKEEDKAFSLIGNYACIGLESTDFNKSIEIFSILNFQKTMGGIDQGWIALNNQDGLTISIMMPMACPHLFFNPSLSYFNGANNLSIIKKIKDIGITITEEITHFNSQGIVDNIIIRDPGGLGFFIFND